MDQVGDLRSYLRDESRVADDLRDRGREVLRAAVRRGHEAGLSQREIADAVGRSQPEISRLLRFYGRTPRGKALESHRREVIAAVRAAGGRRPRVFGSVARGSDGADSDVDLLIDLPSEMSLFSLARLERELSRIVGATVQVVPDERLRDNLRPRVLADAVPL